MPYELVFKRDSDADYVTYRVGYGPKQNPEGMNFMFGGSVGGGKPKGLADTSIQWSTREWKCDEVVKGQEWFGVGSDGRRSRYITLPFGFAAYRDVSEDAAAEFDKVLDGGCCGKSTRRSGQSGSHPH